VLYGGHMTKEDTLEELGGEPLEGSGFENETPEFSESDTQGEIPPASPRG
jgi:hypothetical protein